MSEIKVKQISVIQDRLLDFLEFIKNNIPENVVPDFEHEIEDPVMRAIDAGDPIDMAQLLAYLLLPKYKLDERTVAKKFAELIKTAIKDYQTYVNVTLEVAKSKRNRLLRRMA